MEFQYHLPVNLIFGKGKASLIGEKTAEYGKKALIVTGGNSTRKSGLLNRTQSLLNQAGVTSYVFDEVTPNPMTTTVYQGAEITVKEGCDVVVAIGGGSSIDAGKAIAFQTVNGGDINDYIFGIKSSTKALPVIAVPTTCGTGSEGNGFAVLTNPETHDKKSLRCNAIVPACSIIDPELMMTMPKNVLVSVGFDALCHNIDAYISRVSQPLTDMMALYGASLAAENVLKLAENPADEIAWENLSLASTLGGMVINTAGVTALHGLEHPVSGLRDIVHGRGLASLAPVVFTRSIHGNPGKFAALSHAIGGKDENDFVAVLITLMEKLGVYAPLSSYGITKNDVDWLTDNALKISAAGIAWHPVVFTREEIRQIYLDALDSAI